MLRIHFTPDDLAGVRLAPAGHELAVTTLSAFPLRHGGGRRYEHWRRATWSGTSRRLRPLLDLAAPAPGEPVPAFLRPHGEALALDDALEVLLSTPRHVVRADLEHVSRRRRLPPWTRHLADGDPAVLLDLAGAVRAHHRAGIRAYWPGIRTLLGADHARRARRLRDGDVGGVLASLHPRVRWRPPVLEVAGGRDEPAQDYHLRGRGLVLVPTFFATYAPCDPDDPEPALFYDASHSSSVDPLEDARPPGRERLAALLGHSRAAALEVVAAGVSTSELARRAGLSVASASEHATVLREAGLVETRRVGRAVRHSLTPLGADLLVRSGRLPRPSSGARAG